MLDTVAVAGVYPDDAELLSILEEQWPKALQAEHPHYGLYRPKVWQWIKRLRDNFPMGLRGTRIETELVPLASPRSSNRQVKLSPLYHLSEGGRRQTFIQLRIQGREKKGTVTWSQLPEHQRLTFALIEHQYGGINPLVLDIDDGVFRHFEWKRGDKGGYAIRQARSQAQAALDALCDGRYEAEQSDFHCDRCRVRKRCRYGGIDLDLRFC